LERLRTLTKYQTNIRELERIEKEILLYYKQFIQFKKRLFEKVPIFGITNRCGRFLKEDEFIMF